MEQAIARGKNLPVSTKAAIMVCAHLRNRSYSSATRILKAAIAEEEAIPFTRFNDGVGHRKGMASGRYAVNTCKAILMLLESAKANAINKGLGEELVISEIRANKAASQMRFGRQSRRQAKRTHIIVALSENEAPTKKAPKKATPKKAAPAKTAAKTASKTAAKTATKPATAEKVEAKAE